MAQRKKTARSRNPAATKQARARKASTTPVQVVTGGTSMRIVEPVKSPKRRASKPKVVNIVGQTDDVILDQVGGFANFIREYGVVGLAIGFIAGQQANGVVKQMVASFVEPAVSVWFGGQKLEDRKFYLHHAGQNVPFAWGQFVYLLLELVLVLVFVYLVVKVFKLDRLKKVEIVETKK